MASDAERQYVGVTGRGRVVGCDILFHIVQVWIYPRQREDAGRAILKMIDSEIAGPLELATGSGTFKISREKREDKRRFRQDPGQVDRVQTSGRRAMIAS